MQRLPLDACLSVKSAEVHCISGVRKVPASTSATTREDSSARVSGRHIRMTVGEDGSSSRASRTSSCLAGDTQIERGVQVYETKEEGLHEQPGRSLIRWAPDFHSQSTGEIWSSKALSAPPPYNY